MMYLGIIDDEHLTVGFSVFVRRNERGNVSIVLQDDWNLYERKWELFLRTFEFI